MWVCKLPQCAANVKEQDIVTARLHSGELLLRKVLATPGDAITITDKGKVVTSRRNFKWKDESAFIQSRSIYIPKVGDTLYFDKLNDVEQDYLISLLRGMGEDVFVKTTLWQGDREINIDRVGATKIANRQVSLKEIDFLPWQDRYLIELQIRRSEPGNSPIKLKRSLFRNKKSETQKVARDSLAEDSLADISLSLPDEKINHEAADSTALDSASLDSTALSDPTENAEQVDQVVITKDCYFLACEKGSSCLDSRELGYFTADRITGLHLKKPDEFKEKFIEPAATYLRGIKAVALDIWHIASDAFNKAYDIAIEKFRPEEENEEEAP